MPSPVTPRQQPLVALAQRALCPPDPTWRSMVHGTYKLLSNCSYNPIISRVTVVMGLILRL